MTNYDVWKLAAPPWYDEEPQEEEREEVKPATLYMLIIRARLRRAAKIREDRKTA